MSRGKKVFFSGLALLGLSSFLVYTSPAEAAITVSSGTAAGVDNLAPGPVGAVTVTPDLGVPNVTVAWTLAADDFRRSAPASSDFTSGGVCLLALTMYRATMSCVGLSAVKMLWSPRSVLVAFLT